MVVELVPFIQYHRHETTITNFMTTTKNKMGISTSKRLLNMMPKTFFLVESGLIFFNSLKSQQNVSHLYKYGLLFHCTWHLKECLYLNPCNTIVLKIKGLYFYEEEFSIFIQVMCTHHNHSLTKMMPMTYANKWSCALN